MKSIKTAAHLVLIITMFLCWLYAIWAVVVWHQLAFLGTVIVVPVCARVILSSQTF